MFLKECLNNEKSKDCTIIYNERYNYELKFSTTLDNVALINLTEDEEAELNNQHECYSIPYFHAIQNIWRIK